MPQVIFEPGKQKLPIKVWTDDKDKVDAKTLEQALNLANLPFVYKWPALMPDFHLGYGMPIGGVIATKGVVIPNAVGVDIGCGMGYVQTQVDASVLQEVMTGSGELAKAILGDMRRSIPVGFGHHKEERPGAYDVPEVSKAVQDFMNAVRWPHESQESYDLWRNLHKYSTSFGTLGGGNHFIELQVDGGGKLGVMIHSGSRSLGAAVAKVYNDKARVLNEKYFSTVPKEWGLSFLPVDTHEGQEYIHWMKLACAFAKASRADMLTVVKNILQEKLWKHAKVELAFDTFDGLEIINDVHHNYAAIEHHFGENVWVHRKGAIRARNWELGIIPGAMGSSSYLVRGLDNKDSFTSASHGAGRTMSRTQAKKVLKDEVLHVVGRGGGKDLLDEHKGAYKDVEEVLENEMDLVVPIKRLHTLTVGEKQELCVLKG